MSFPRELRTYVLAREREAEDVRQSEEKAEKGDTDHFPIF